MTKNRHHIWFPRSAYTTPLERKFRGLACQIVQLDMQAHCLLHMYGTPPDKPSRKDMEAAVERHNDRRCGCWGGGRDGPVDLH